MLALDTPADSWIITPPVSEALYRRNAATCYELARIATNEDEKVRWIVLAQDWLERADAWQASGDPPADQSTEQVAQQQQQIQPTKKKE
jgi:hypothetical protein